MGYIEDNEINKLTQEKHLLLRNIDVLNKKEDKNILIDLETRLTEINKLIDDKTEQILKNVR